MSLKNLKTSDQKLLKSLLCFICVFCIEFAGCKTDFTPVTIQPQQKDIRQPAENLHSEDVVAKQIEQLNRKNASLTDKRGSRVLPAFPEPKADGNNQPRLKTQGSTLVSGVRGQQSDEPITTSAQLSSKERPHLVNMPALDKPGMADELISVNFEQVDIRTVLKTLGDITGINFIVDENVRGTVTLMSPTKIRLGDLYKVLESILEVQGYAAVPAENLVKIVPRADAAKRNLQVRVGSNPAEIPRSDSIVTQIIPLSYADAAEVSQIIQPLLATGSQMATYN